jgi:hypothetical protein
MVIQFVLKTELGEFKSETMCVTEEQYSTLIEKCKTYYNGGFDMYLPKGFLVASAELIKKSILMIEIIE